MKVNGTAYLTIWMEGREVKMIDQNLLPWSFVIHTCSHHLETCDAIRHMTVRGAGAIGAAAAFAMAQAFLEAPAHDATGYVLQAKKNIEATRPTARNLFYAVDQVYEAGKISVEDAVEAAQKVAAKDIDDSRKIGFHGNQLIHHQSRILTHCNAGWLAFVDYGTALSPIYTAHDEGKDIFVYAGETRPRGQGARLTAWELHNAGIPHLVVPDNAVASLMAQQKIDLVIVGADRIATNGDVANKIGTLDRAILASHYRIPFYVAAPTSTFDAACQEGKEIVIEHRHADEVSFQEGPDREGKIHQIRVVSEGSVAINPAFDISPASLITGIITEHGLVKADHAAIAHLLNIS